MTIVKSQLLLPDQCPLPGAQVTATMRATPSWLKNRDGRVLGTVETYTNAEGWWRMDLMPVNEVETSEFVFYEITEAGRTRHFITVPEPSGTPGEEWLLRDLLVDRPPDPPDGRWRPIDRMSKLQDVDKALDTAPEGSVLIKRGGLWSFGPHALSALVDVDAASVAVAPIGAKLEYLGQKGWGVPTDEPTGTAKYTVGDDTSDPTGMTVLVTITDRPEDRPIRVDWLDGDAISDLPVGTATASHPYMSAGQKFPDVFYADGEHESAEPEDDGSATLPFPREHDEEWT